MKNTKVTTSLGKFLEWCLYIEVNKFRCMDDSKEYEIVLDSGEIRFKDQYGQIQELESRQFVEFTLTDDQEQIIFENIKKMWKVEYFIKFGGDLI